MKKIFLNNYKFIIILFFILILFSIKFPYYIDTPGGIDDVSKKIDIDGYSSAGSFNLTYVREYNATIPTLIFSLFNKDWDVFKKDEVLLDTETDKTYTLRDQILMKESISNAIYVAYTKANRTIDVTNTNIYVTYISSNADTDLSVGDIITSINDIDVLNIDSLTKIINNYNIGTKLKIKVLNNNKEYDRYAYVINENGNKKIGILPSIIMKYNTEPKISINIDENESGSSGGLALALSIYNSLIEEDITHGLKIVATGTIDLDGNIGSIGGIEYKLKSAEKSKSDLFIVPNDSNYDEAIKIKKKKNYNIKIIGVSNFDEAIKYLKSI